MSKQHQKVKALRQLKRNMGRFRGGGYASIDHKSAVEAIDCIDWAISVCEAADNLVNVKGCHHAEVAYRRLEVSVNGEGVRVLGDEVIGKDRSNRSLP